MGTPFEECVQFTKELLVQRQNHLFQQLKLCVEKVDEIKKLREICKYAHPNYECKGMLKSTLNLLLEKELERKIDEEISQSFFEMESLKQKAYIIGKNKDFAILQWKDRE